MEKRMEQIEKQLEFIKSVIMGNKKTLTLKEGCKYSGYSISYMYKLTSGKEIPHLKRGKKVFFDKDELDAWLRQNKIQDIYSKARNIIKNE
jgi:excisionase family DNA binding protein